MPRSLQRLNRFQVETAGKLLSDPSADGGICTIRRALRQPRVGPAFLRLGALLFLSIAGQALAAEPLAQPSPTASVQEPAVESKNALPAEVKAAAGPPTPRSAEGEIDEAWSRCRSALNARRWAELESLSRRLIELKEDLGIADLAAHAVELIRASEAVSKEGDNALAVKLADSAVQLAPHLPAAHWALAWAYFSNAVGEPALYLGEAQQAFREWLDDLRYQRSGIADVGTSVLFALLATVVVVLALLALRRWQYLFHDFNHFFPRGAAQWETSVLAVILIALPVVFHLGVVPLLLAAFAASVLYLSFAERCVAAVLMSALGFFPFAAGTLAHYASFSGTPGEDVYLLERGGVAAAGAEQRIQKRASDEKAEFAELFAIGRYELRRGQTDLALRYLEQASLKRGDNAQVLTNLGNAMFAKGDLEGAAEAYSRATQLDPALAAPVLNLAKLYELRTRLTKAPAPDHREGGEAGSVPSTSAPRALGQAYLNRMLLGPPVPAAEISALANSTDQQLKVERQVSIQLLGQVDPPLSWLYPLIASLLLVAAGFVSPTLAVSTPCEKCGRPVCQRCDPGVVSGGMFCSQCVEVFVHSKDVAPELRVRKQLEVARHHLRFDKVAYFLGFVCSGAGHLYSGEPVRGALYAFVFLFAFTRILLRQGVLRHPYVVQPSLAGLIPVAVVLLLVHYFSIRALYRLRS